MPTSLCSLPLIMWVFFCSPENKSYSSVRTEALAVVDLLVKRTAGTFPRWQEKSRCSAVPPVADVLLICSRFEFLCSKSLECFRLNCNSTY